MLAEHFQFGSPRETFGTVLGLLLNEHLLCIQETPSADEAEFGEWPHVCALLKKEDIGGVRSDRIYRYVDKNDNM